MSATGRFFVIDGPEGAGKSTQLARVTDYLTARGHRVQSWRDPGGTAVGERIRALLLDARDVPIAPLTELMLFLASRAQLVDECVAPALARGETVLLDRFYHATIAYQIHGLGADRLPADAEAIVRALAGVREPDRVWLLDVPPALGRQRIAREGDRIERRDEAFHERVRAGFRAQAEAAPDAIAWIDATGTPDEVFAAIVDDIERRGLA